MKRRVSVIIILLVAVSNISGCVKSSKSDDTGDGNGKIIQPAEPAKEDVKPPVQNPPMSSPDSDPIKAQVNKMTMNEKIGQMVMSGVDGYTVSDTTVKLIKD